ncbi:NACHT, LRR and PYD domains-containing protein 12-like [Megalops cyprinoides]|uniref:NACHT, LRR and PYD domains-containing protein 12-like n=1 Tax=Megalops cyprinoides TaxID=118141 RepID=UPI001864220A|nr:NACHT, LRR and PYD domains-containing protein 12-like [Megalops cyprinoides]
MSSAPIRASGAGEDNVELAPTDLRSAALTPSITAQTGGNAVVPQIDGCHVSRDLNVTINLSSDNKVSPALIRRGSEVTDTSRETPGVSDDVLAALPSTVKSLLESKYKCINEGLAEQGNHIFLNKIYTELYTTEGRRGDINNEHEVRQIETASKKQAKQETAIKCNDIFKALPGQEKHIRTVLTKGIAGIGKTVSVQKFILDWAGGKANQDVDFIFPLPFRELNLMKDEKCSLMQLLQPFFPGIKELGSIKIDCYKVVFIFDGLDECRLPLDFVKNKSWCDVTEPTSVDVLLTNLIKGNLLPSALLWITSRPAAANQIPPECVHQVTEVRGFNDPQKEEYFMKRFSDQKLASRIITHIKSSRSLYIMCHIPVFCWIAATVLEQIMGESDSGEIPKTLTHMYTNFLLLQASLRNQKYLGTTETNLVLNRESILKLGKLAFQQLEKGNLIFYTEDLRESGIDITEASVYSGVCTELFRKEPGIRKQKVYSFVHLSVQEYLAALYVFLSYRNSNRNLLDHSFRSRFFRLIPHSNLAVLLKSAVDQALQSENGHLDLFLRFLLGLSLDSNQTLLRGLLTQTGSSSQSIKKTVQYIKKKIRKNLCPERSINLFQCLNEVNDHSLVEEIQSYLSSGNLSRQDLSPAQWSALVFVLLTSEEALDVFDLKKYMRSDEGLLRLLPVVKATRKALLNRCNLSNECCEALASAISSNSSSLRELDLSDNELQDSGVELLSAGLGNPHCKLEILSLSGCRVTERGCVFLASALHSNPSHLRELDLKELDVFDLKKYMRSDEGLLRLLPVVKASRTALLNSCNLSKECCEGLASGISSNSSGLRELDLSDNELQDSGVELLSAGLGNPQCKLETLRLNSCNLSKECCEALASAISSNSSSLRELDLSDNDLQDSGVELLSAGLGNTHCKLETLSLSGCRVTERGCVSLASALHKNPSHLRELDLSYNHPGESGVRALSAGLEDPKCKLETLSVDHGGECRIKPGLKKYACQLTLDPNTVHRKLSLSEGHRKVTHTRQGEPYSDHPERFEYWTQVLCREGLSGRCYWEAEWSGRWTHIGVAYKGISRKKEDSRLGHNNQSWCLAFCGSYTVWHNKEETPISAPPSPSCRVGVYLDWPAGTLSFYSVSSDTLTLLHTFHTTFTEPLYPGFTVGLDCPVSLCQLE